VLSLIERGQKDGSFSTALKPQAMTSALLGAAEGMMRDRLLAAQHSGSSPFPDSQIRAVFGALVTGLGPAT